MNIKYFFDFSSKYVSSTVLASPEGLKKDTKFISGHHKLIKGDYSEIDFPITFKQEEGKYFTDILDTGHVSFFLISDRLKEILEENDLTGWKTFPIKLYDKKGNEVFGYHGFSVTGRCGPMNYENAEIIEKRYVPEGPLCKFYKGYYVGINDWDGSDFFSPSKVYAIIVTRKAADILKKNKITNLRLENLAKIEVAVRNVKKSSQ